MNNFFYDAVVAIVNKSVNTRGELVLEKLSNELKIVLPKNDIKVSVFSNLLKDEVINSLQHILFNYYLDIKNKALENKKIEDKKFLADKIGETEKKVILDIFDNSWSKHIDDMSIFREGVYLKSYANVDPLQFYVEEGFKMFNEMFENISIAVISNILQGLLLLKSK